MNVQERLGRRKEEARAGLEVARGKTAAPPAFDRSAVAAFAKSIDRACVLKGGGADALAAAAVIKVLGKREGGRDVATGDARFDHPIIIENPPRPLWLVAAMLLGHDDLQVPQQDDFATRLAALIAGLARGGADKLTILPSPRLKAVGAFVQRLLERIPVVNGEPNGKKSDYAIDRFFVSMALASEQHDMTYLAEAGHPVVQWKLASPDEISAEIVRWQIVNAMLDQLLPPPSAVEATQMPAEPSLRAKGLALFAPPDHAHVLRAAAGTLGEQAAISPAGWIAAQLALGDPGDHVALGIWLPREIEDDLSALQGAIRNVTRLACTRAFEYVRPDPRGIFLLLTSGEAPTRDLPAGRALRIHTEDGDPARILESLRDAAKMLSRK
ncbi:MAG: hypothetical protein LC689_12025 [Myxococcales bacterium]|nr:hypothetical protein [Myxococcales bacterium]